MHRVWETFLRLAKPAIACAMSVLAGALTSLLESMEEGTKINLKHWAVVTGCALGIALINLYMKPPVNGNGKNT